MTPKPLPDHPKREDEPRCYTSYAVINFHAQSPVEAARKIKAAERVLNLRAGVDAVLDDECYRWNDDHSGTEPWDPHNPLAFDERQADA